MNRKREITFHHNWQAQGKENIPPFSPSNPHSSGCFAPCLHILSLLRTSIELSQSHISRNIKKKETKYHRKILVFHSEINAPCHFGKVSLDFFFSSWQFDPSSVEKMGVIPPASMTAGSGPSWEEFTLQRYFLQLVSQLKQCWCGPLNRDLLTALTPEDSGLDDLLQSNCGTEHSTRSSGALCSTAAVNTCKSTYPIRESRTEMGEQIYRVGRSPSTL